MLRFSCNTISATALCGEHLKKGVGKPGRDAYNKLEAEVRGEPIKWVQPSWNSTDTAAKITQKLNTCSINAMIMHTATQLAMHLKIQRITTELNIKSCNVMWKPKGQYL